MVYAKKVYGGPIIFYFGGVASTGLIECICVTSGSHYKINVHFCEHEEADDRLAMYYSSTVIASGDAECTYQVDYITILKHVKLLPINCYCGGFLNLDKKR